MEENQRNVWQIERLEYEKTCIERGFENIVGIDEAGRGALAGILVVSGVILDLDNLPEGIDDSKKLSVKKRELLYTKINESAKAVMSVFVSPSRIDQINIYRATQEAMRKIAEEIIPKADVALTDAMPIKNATIPVYDIIKGDALSLSIGAASIIAKVERDAYMDCMDNLYPYYDWKKNKGYGTKSHIEAIYKKGVTAIHRKTFSPVSEFYSNEQNLF